MLNYFNPVEEKQGLEKSKATALKWIMLSLFFLLILLIIQSWYTQDYISASDYFLPVGLLFVLVVLFVLRYYGVRKAGNIFSIGAIVIMVIVINIFDQDTIFTKYSEELYLAIFVLVFISLFSTRRVLLIAAALFFISSFYVSINLQRSFPEHESILQEVQIFFSFTLITITLILYYVTKFSDTAVKKAQEDAQIKEKQNEALEKVVKELDRFVYSASHDLSAPLKSILGLVNIARIENTNEDVAKHLDYIEESITKQEAVIASLIQYSQNSRLDISMEKVKIHSIVDGVIDDLKYVPGFADVQIINNVIEDKTVNTDPTRIKMIIGNLLSNGIKYRHLSRESCFVKIDFENGAGSWQLKISDNGQGISEEHQDKVFSMFYRANKQPVGSGLGLYIVQETVEMLGGKVTLESRVNKGSTFVLSLPS